MVIKTFFFAKTFDFFFMIELDFIHVTKYNSKFTYLASFLFHRFDKNL
jgi:hypothetical protein